MRQVDARDALVVGGERHRHMRRAVLRQRMVRRHDAEDRIVRGQVDLHHHMAAGHLVQQPARVRLLHYIHAVPNPFRVAQLDRLADVELQPVGRHQPRRKLARVQRDVNLADRCCADNPACASAGCTRSWRGVRPPAARSSGQPHSRPRWPPQRRAASARRPAAAGFARST